VDRSTGCEPRSTAETRAWWPAVRRRPRCRGSPAACGRAPPRSAARSDAARRRSAVSSAYRWAMYMSALARASVALSIVAWKNGHWRYMSQIVCQACRSSYFGVDERRPRGHTRPGSCSGSASTRTPRESPAGRRACARRRRRAGRDAIGRVLDVVDRRRLREILDEPRLRRRARGRPRTTARHALHEGAGPLRPAAPIRRPARRHRAWPTTPARGAGGRCRRRRTRSASTSPCSVSRRRAVERSAGQREDAAGRQGRRRGRASRPDHGRTSGPRRGPPPRHAAGSCADCRPQQAAR